MAVIHALVIMLMLMLMVFMYFFSMASSSNSSSPKKKKSSSGSSIIKRFKYDVFLSFSGKDTRTNFVDHLYEALKEKGIYSYKDDEKIQKGKRIKDDLLESIEDSRFYIIVFSKNYASSSWCLDELVKIMECQKMTGHTAYPVFYDVEPTEVRNQNGAVGEAFFKNKNKDAAEKWKGALKEAADLAGWELKNTLDGHEAKFIRKIVGEISLELRSINFGFDEKLVGMKTRVERVVSSLEIGIKEVRMIGIKGMGGAGKTTTARAVYNHLSNDFEAKSFVANVRDVSNASMFGLKNLQEQVLSDVLKEKVTLNSVDDGKNMMKDRMCGTKVLLVLDDVDHIEQLEALAGELNWFEPGSRIIITTRDEQVLAAHKIVKLIPDIDLLSAEEAICLFSRNAFGTEIPSQGYKELSGKVVTYAAGLPLTIKLLGSFLCGKDKDVWVSAIDRLRTIPFKDTLKRLKISYDGLEEDDYEKIFQDVACILKGESKQNAIKMFECCGIHAINGLKVLEQRSLITVDPFGVLGMHDHIEEMGKNIVRGEHPDEPKKHSHLWIDKEIEDILANDKGTEATRCLKLIKSRKNERIFMKGLGKMKELRYLDVTFAEYEFETDCESDDDSLGRDMKINDPELNDISQYFIKSLKYLKCSDYPFLYLPNTFEANNLVGLHMKNSRLKRLWEKGEEKILEELRFLFFNKSRLRTFDFSITPNLETLSLRSCHNLREFKLYMPCQKLNYLNVAWSGLETFNLGLTPNLESFIIQCCSRFHKLRVPAACPNLKFLEFYEVRLRSLDLELIQNLERLNLQNCCELVEINAPVGCLKKVVQLDLSGCLRFKDFHFNSREPKVNCSSATLHLVGEVLDSCEVHRNSSLPKLQFHCYYNEYLPSSVGNIEKLTSFGLCACTDLEKFSNIICSLQCLKRLALKCNVPEFPKDLGQLQCLEELCLYSTKIKHLPDSICMLKRLKSLKVNDGDLLEKLPEDLGNLECLERLHLSSKKIEYLPDSICRLRRLRRLDAINCSCLANLPEGIGQIESLKRLVLSATMIKHLPDSVCNLKHLKYLNLHLCALLEKLPEDLGGVECLEKLIITDTGISHLPKSILGSKGLFITASPELLQQYDFPSSWQQNRKSGSSLPVIEDSCKQIMDAARTTNAKTMGPVPLSTKQKSTVEDGETTTGIVGADSENFSAIRSNYNDIFSAIYF